MDADKMGVARMLLSIRDASVALGVSERTIWTLTQEGQLPHVRIGRRLLFSQTALAAWIAQQESTQ